MKLISLEIFKRICTQYSWCIDVDNNASLKIQQIMFDNGIYWKNGDCSICNIYQNHALYFNKEFNYLFWSFRFEDAYYNRNYNHIGKLN